MMQGNGLLQLAPGLLGVMGSPSPFWGVTGAQKWPILEPKILWLRRATL